MKRLNVILTLGKIAHNSSIIALNKNHSEYKFKHLKKHKINDQIILIIVITIQNITLILKD